MAMLAEDAGDIKGVFSKKAERQCFWGIGSRMAANDWILRADDKLAYQLCADTLTMKAIIGRSGFVKAVDKREGDGATPCGRWPVRNIYYRADRIACPKTVIACHKLTPDCGWCDDGASVDYNRHITRPFQFRHEQMWRADAAYDLVIELGYNDAPVISGHGSAIFLHCIAAGQTTTDGCVAVDREGLVRLVAGASADQHLLIPERLLTP